MTSSCRHGKISSVQLLLYLKSADNYDTLIAVKDGLGGADFGRRDMDKYTKEELTQALRCVCSVIQKCEKAQEKFPGGTPHHTLLKNRLKAMYISKALIEEALDGAE